MGPHLYSIRTKPRQDNETRYRCEVYLICCMEHARVASFQVLAWCLDIASAGMRGASQHGMLRFPCHKRCLESIICKHANSLALAMAGIVQQTSCPAPSIQHAEDVRKPSTVSAQTLHSRRSRTRPSCCTACPSARDVSRCSLTRQSCCTACPTACDVSRALRAGTSSQPA